jgi:hypothetical protein
MIMAVISSTENTMPAIAADCLVRQNRPVSLVVSLLILGHPDRVLRLE